MGEWSFEHTIFTNARRRIAWAYWSDLRNHAEMEPGVEKIELDGPCAKTSLTSRAARDVATRLDRRSLHPGCRFRMNGASPPYGAPRIVYSERFTNRGA